MSNPSTPRFAAHTFENVTPVATILLPAERTRVDAAGEGARQFGTRASELYDNASERVQGASIYVRRVEPGRDWRGKELPEKTE